MKNGMSLKDLAIEVERQNASKRDFVITPNLMTMGVAENQIVVRLPKKDGDTEMFGVNPTAHDQLSEFIDIPRNYYRRMQTNAPALLTANVNRWLGDRSDEKKDTRLIRCLDGNVRGILSDRYRRLDNYDLAKVILPIISQHDFRVESCNISEKNMHLKVVSQTVKADVQPGNHTFLKNGGDPLYFGMTFSNSEIGFGTLGIEEMLYRLVCRNGAISESMVNRRHVGSKVGAGDGSWELFSNDTKRQSDRAFWMQVEDVVKACVSQAKDRFDKLIVKVEGAQAQEVKSPTGAIELLQENYGVSEAEGNGILTHLTKGGDLSLWGLVNAVTAFAQDDSLSYERATDLERLGGKLLNAKSKDFEPAKELVAA